MTINKDALYELTQKTICERKEARLQKLEKIVEIRILPELVKSAEAGFFSHTVRNLTDLIPEDVAIIRNIVKKKYGLDVVKLISNQLEFTISWNK